MEFPKFRRNSEVPAPRRVVTSPIPSTTSHFDASTSHSVVETLYDHPNAKIIAFTASGRAFARSRAKGELPAEEEPGTLSWSSQIERTIAVGPFRIYRTPGSVAFVNCGSALQPIFPKSQCWCIDEVNSKFVLQIRRPNYWRIELPVSNPEEQRLAEMLRGVMDQVLQFEKTECPFKRSFAVVLPQRPQTPVKKRPWTPLRRSPAHSIEDPDSPLSRPSSVTSTAAEPRPIWGASGADIANHKSAVRLRSASLLPSETTNVDPAPGDQTQMEHPEGHEPEPSNASHSAPAISIPIVTINNEASTNSSMKCKNVTESRPQVPITESTHPNSPGERLHIREEKYALFETDNGEKGFETFQPICEDRREESADDWPDSQVVLDEAGDVAYEGTGYQGDERKTRLRRRVGRAIPRSVSTPHLRLTMEPPSQLPPMPPMPVLYQQPTHSAQSLSPNESQDSFHSADSWHSSNAAMPPSPSTSRPESPLLCPPSHGKTGCTKPSTSIPTPKGSSTGHVASTDGSIEGLATAPDASSDPSAKETRLTSMIPEGQSGASTAFLSQRSCTSHQTTTSSISRRRTLSPLPPAANLFSTPVPEQRPPSRSRLETVKQLPMAIISKTYEIILGPPSHLIALMLKVAAKIAAGQWRGIVYGYGEDGEAIPVQWDYSEAEFSDWSDDEPYMGIRRRRHSMATHKAQPPVDANSASDDSRSWGVD